jgi:hypothetical protein
MASQNSTMTNIQKLVNSNTPQMIAQEDVGLKTFRSVLFIILFAVLLVVMFVIGYDLYFKNKVGDFSKVTNVIIPYIHDAKIEKNISDVSVPASGSSVNYNMWLYISDYNYRSNEDKCVFYKGRPSGPLVKADVNPNNVNIFQGMPGVWLLAKQNTMRVSFALETVLNQPPGRPECSNSLGNSDGRDVRCFNTMKVDSIDIENIPLQRWCSVNITIHDNVVDVWMDGYLTKSKVLKGFPLVNTDILHICPNGGFNGFLSKFSITNTPLSSKEIKGIYNQGPVLKKPLISRMVDSLF